MALQAPQEEQDMRAAGITLIVAFLATVALFAAHPAESGATIFAEVLKNEARDAFVDAVVHGGFIAVIAVELVCFAVFAARLGFLRILPLAGFIFTATGLGFIMGSMLMDGLVVPAIAQRFAGVAAQRLDMAHTLVIFCGTVIRVLLPIGMLFQAAGICAWSIALAGRPGVVRGIAVAGLLASILLVAAVGASAMSPPALMAGFAVTALWALAIGGLLATRKI